MTATADIVLQLRGRGEIAAYPIELDGSLSFRGRPGGLPANAAASGLAAYWRTFMPPVRECSRAAASASLRMLAYGTLRDAVLSLKA